ncbi:hypothetical protein PAXINDRAFT_155780 [Paxillus involutus ATCC 200175]|uniref:Uncharacterized protein n=1 Tax=Paxillus involutus ATCC 200175 TaxID=664439 RepID=A0A0C9U7V9_PAXIN|nr:hypothetical protein PAXINDRAFT_155780 [Paxillus involutus ATCC 200175]
MSQFEYRADSELEDFISDDFDIPVIASDEEDQEIDQLISETLQNEPALKPDMPAKPEPKRRQKRKEPADEPAKKQPKPEKSRKSKTPAFESDGEEEPKLSIRAYLHLETTTSQPGRGHNKPPTTVTKAAQCAPFIFHADDTFKFFTNAIATAAKTTAANLTLSRLRWKFETPANLPMKVLSNSVGYDAMIETVKERTKGHTIFLFLPKPVDLEAPATEVSSRNNGTYEYDEDPGDVAPEDLSHKAQISALRAGFSTEREDLE